MLVPFYFWYHPGIDSVCDIHSANYCFLEICRHACCHVHAFFRLEIHLVYQNNKMYFKNLITANYHSNYILYNNLYTMDELQYRKGLKKYYLALWKCDIRNKAATQKASIWRLSLIGNYSQCIRWDALTVLSDWLLFSQLSKALHFFHFTS